MFNSEIEAGKLAHEFTDFPGMMERLRQSRQSYDLKEKQRREGIRRSAARWIESSANDYETIRGVATMVGTNEGISLNCVRAAAGYEVNKTDAFIKSVFGEDFELRDGDAGVFVHEVANLLRPIAASLAG